MCVCVCVWVGVANSVWVWLVGLNKQPFVPRYFGYQGSVELFIVSKGVSFVTIEHLLVLWLFVCLLVYY
jgi:hypothetical protein